jgi:hypothetical protein
MLNWLAGLAQNFAKLEIDEFAAFEQALALFARQRIKQAIAGNAGLDRRHLNSPVVGGARHPANGALALQPGCRMEIRGLGRRFDVDLDNVLQRGAKPLACLRGSAHKSFAHAA